MATFISLIQSIPVLVDLVERFVALYVASRIGSMKKEHREGIKKALAEQDQRDLERAIGSPVAGLPSGVPGTEVRPTLPGVKP